MKLYRQGDVLLREVKTSKGNKIATKKYTLAFGEVTGHHHDIIGDVTVFQQQGEHADNLVGSGNGLLCVEVHSEAQLTHQEHDFMNIPKGVYEIVLQREYDVVEGIRQVLD